LQQDDSDTLMLFLRNDPPSQLNEVRFIFTT